MIELLDLTATYRVGTGSVTPLDRVTATIRSGSTALMGPSGSGKSTLLRIIAGVQRPTAGEVVLDGVARSDRGPQVAMVYQDYRLVDFLTVGENLQLAAHLRAVPSSEEAVASALQAVGLNDYEKRMPETLSGGEQQRVAIARALVVSAEILLADEPTGALDEQNTLRIARLLRRLADERKIVVLVATHDKRVAEIMENKIVISDEALHEQDSTL